MQDDFNSQCKAWTFKEYNKTTDRLSKIDVKMPNDGIEFSVGKNFECGHVIDLNRRNALCCRKKNANTLNNFIAFYYNQGHMTMQAS